MKMPTYFISHGGGPWPWLQGAYKEACTNLKISLEHLPMELPEKPKAILIISGHWEESEFKISSGAKPGMVYDYYGFPDYTYQIKYPAPGSPDLANRVKSLIDGVGFNATLDPDRGFDHGTFTPLAVAFPNADVPVVQLSLRADYDPETHLKVGRAIAPLRDEGILIIGSGLSYHNLRMFDARAMKPSHEFDHWLQESIVRSHPKDRTEKLKSWENAPSARLAHPQEDHLLPLMVAVGAAENEKAEMSYHEDHFLGGIAVSSFKFG
jgi:aromatic ring-opening dioxygenase catalytic subunit (LigB family)